MFLRCIQETLNKKVRPLKFEPNDFCVLMDHTARSLAYLLLSWPANISASCLYAKYKMCWRAFYQKEKSQRPPNSSVSVKSAKGDGAVVGSRCVCVCVCLCVWGVCSRLQIQIYMPEVTFFVLTVMLLDLLCLFISIVIIVEGAPAL